MIITAYPDIIGRICGGTAVIPMARGHKNGIRVNIGSLIRPGARKAMITVIIAICLAGEILKHDIRTAISRCVSGNNIIIDVNGTSTQLAVAIGFNASPILTRPVSVYGVIRYSNDAD